MEKKLYRSTTDRKIAGVCAGLAEYMGADVSLVRLVTALLIFVGGLSIFAYVIAALIIPEDPGYIEGQASEKNGQH